MVRPLVLLFALSGCVFVDDATLKARLDPDGDGAAYPEDCDSNDASVFPGAEEACDGTDQDCDGEIDEGLGATWYADADGDGYGDLAAPVVVCEGSTGVVENADDCDDGDAEVHPGAVEADCEDPVDYNCDGSTGSDDGDGDGTIACEDCDDADAARYPGAAEVCDEVDQDCDGEVDEDATDAGAWFVDADADGFGDAGTSVAACDMPDGYVADATDCDDADQGAYPGAAETCDPGDDDCDGEVDEDATDALAWYADADGDGSGEAALSVAACEAPEGYVANDTDCDDGDAAFHPGADEADCTDPSDYNCDGSVAYADADGDGFAACEDCDDTRADVSPVGVEVCGDVDEDCDGVVDEADAFDAATWYVDADADGYGDATLTAAGCSAPYSYVADATDCDDTRGDVSPAGVEACGDVDEDCDGTEDEAGAVGESTWYADADGDGYGDAGATVAACDAPSGYLFDATDCDDARADVSPVGTEVCDAANADEDCDGLTEDDDPSLDASTRGSFYSDLDGDGYGAGGASRWCDQPARTSANGTDCDDGDGAVNPGASEDCATTADDDCDGAVDGEGATGCVIRWLDTDDDEYGTTLSTCTCSPTGDYTASNSSDCDDGMAGVNPAATEVCDPLDTDEDCDGDSDDDDSAPSGLTTWYVDADGDGYGATTTVSACELPAGYAAASGDCDDADSGASPGLAEVCADGVDNDCDGSAGACSLDGTLYVADADATFDVDHSEPPLGYAADLDGDGADEILTGSPNSGTPAYSGFAYVLSGGGTGALSASTTFSGSSYYQNAGSSIASVGDVDADGYDDLLVGATEGSSCGSNCQGNAYLLRGPFSGSTAVSSATATFSGNSTGYDFGSAVAGAGDIDADGYDDVLVADLGDDTYDSNAGAVYLFLDPVSGSRSASSADAIFSGTGGYGMLAGSDIQGGSRSARL